MRAERAGAGNEAGGRREGETKVSLPGDCAIGSRPVDLHIMGLEQLSAEIEVRGLHQRAAPPNWDCRRARIVFPKGSVGATENLMMAASLARGETVLVNAAREPEIVDHPACRLCCLSASVEGAGPTPSASRAATGCIGRRTASSPTGSRPAPISPGAATPGGEVKLMQHQPHLIEAAADVLRGAGVEFQADGRRLQDPPRRRPGRRRRDDQAASGFPTDLQAQIGWGPGRWRNGAWVIHRDDLREQDMPQPRASANGRQRRPSTAPRPGCAACRS